MKNNDDKRGFGVFGAVAVGILAAAAAIVTVSKKKNKKKMNFFKEELVKLPLFGKEEKPKKPREYVEEDIFEDEEYSTITEDKKDILYDDEVSYEEDEEFIADTHARPIVTPVVEPVRTEKKIIDEVVEKTVNEPVEEIVNEPVEEIVNEPVEEIVNEPVEELEKVSEPEVIEEPEMVEEVVAEEEPVVSITDDIAEEDTPFVVDLYANAKNSSFTEPVNVEESVIKEIIEEVSEETVIAEPVAEESVVEETVIAEPVAEEPAVEEAVIAEPVAEEPAVEEAVIAEPVAEEPAVEEAVIAEPVAEEPVIEEPVIEESVIEEPVIEEIVINNDEPEKEDDDKLRDNESYFDWTYNVDEHYNVITDGTWVYCRTDVELVSTSVNKKGSHEIMDIEDTFKNSLSKPGYCLLKYIGSEKEVVIPSTINGKPVVACLNTFRSNQIIKKVTVPACVEGLRRTFYSCYHLDRIIFEEGINLSYELDSVMCGNNDMDSNTESTTVVCTPEIAAYFRGHYRLGCPVVFIEN